METNLIKSTPRAMAPSQTIETELNGTKVKIKLFNYFAETIGTTEYSTTQNYNTWDKQSKIEMKKTIVEQLKEGHTKLESNMGWDVTGTRQSDYSSMLVHTFRYRLTWEIVECEEISISTMTVPQYKHNTIKYTNIDKVYSGHPDRCMCGCAGEYYSTKRMKLKVMEMLKEFRGNEFQDNIKSIDNYIFTIQVSDTRQYTLYLRDEFKSKQ